MSRVIGLDGYPAGEPVQDVVDTLRDLLRIAEAGQIVGMACAVVTRGDEHTNSALESGWTMGEASYSQICAAANLLSYDIMRFSETGG